MLSMIMVVAAIVDAENGYRVMVLVVAVWVGVEVVVIVVAALMTVIVVLGILAVGHCAPALLKA